MEKGEELCDAGQGQKALGLMLALDQPCRREQEMVLQGGRRLEETDHRAKVVDHRGKVVVSQEVQEVVDHPEVVEEGCQEEAVDHRDHLDHLEVVETLQQQEPSESRDACWQGARLIPGCWQNLRASMARSLHGRCGSAELSDGFRPQMSALQMSCSSPLKRWCR